MRTKTTLVFGKGINFDLPAWELAPGFWSGGSNFRTRNGVEEIWDGAGIHSNTWPITPLWGLPASVSGTQRIVYVGAAKAYTRITAPGDESEITRFTDGKVISSTTSSGTTVTINTAAAHGLTTGNIITAYGFTPSTYNATDVAVTVVDADTFTYTVASAPAVSPPTYIGAYQGNATSDHAALSGTQRYTGGSFNGLLLFNHPADGLYYYSGTGRMKKVPGFNGTATWSTAGAVRTFKSFIVAMNVTENGTSYRQRLKWSDAISDVGALPASWDSTATNKAGQVDLAETDGALVDGLPLGDSFIVYMTDGRYAAQYVETNEVFVFNKLPGGAGLAFPNCVVNTPAGHVFMTPSFDVMVHSGGEPRSIADGKFRLFLDRSVNKTYAHLCFLAHDPQKSEVLICYPNGATAVCDKAIAWNYIENTVGYFDLASGATAASGVSFAANGLWPTATAWHVNVDSLGFFCYHATDSAKTGLYTTQATSGRWFGSQLTGTLTREGMDLGDRDRMKTLHRSRWALDQEGTSGGDTVSIYHGSSMFPDKLATFTNPVTYTVSTTDYANARATQGRFLAIKLVTASLNVLIRVRSVDLDVALGGKR